MDFRHIAAPAAAAGIAALAACTPPPEPTGRELFFGYCTACHGTEAHGDGPRAGSLDRKVPNLTLIARRAGGSFPMAWVMSVIDGHTRVREGNVTMPEFGAALLDGPVVSYDTGDGIPTPTPARLVALAEYLRSIQR